MTQTDRLETQLEMLFSDVAAPDLTGAAEPRMGVGAGQTSRSPMLSRADAPRTLPARPDDWLRQLHRSRLAKPWLVILIFLSVLVVLLIGRENLTWLDTRTDSLASNVSDVQPPDTHPIIQASPTAILTPAVMPFAPPLAAVPISIGSSELRGTVEPIAGLTIDEKPEPTSTFFPTPSPPGLDKAKPTASSAVSTTSSTSNTIRLPAAREQDATPTFPAQGVPPPTLTPTTAPATLEPTRVLSNTIVIPAINLEAPIVEVGYESQVIGGSPAVTWAVPEYFAVGWHQSSAPPGQSGNTVLNGHEYIHGGVFEGLEKLQKDDEIIVYADGSAHHYRVAEQHLLEEEGQPLSVRVENAKWILPTADERLTIVTCAPHKKSTHRLIVVARPAEDKNLSTP